ncbi:MAG: M4 family metallopeptidase [Pirellulales bacterium]
MMKLLEAKDRSIREAALNTLLASVHVRTARALAPGLLAAVNSTGTKRRTIFDAKRNLTPFGELVRGEGGPASPDQAVNDAYDGIGLTYDFYLEEFNRNSLDGNGMRLDAVVHYGDRVNNAFFDGTRMLFGDGDGARFINLTKSPDVIAHELTHGVTRFTAGLDYHKQSGALNESVSDVFGSLVKQWAQNQDAQSADWLIGDGIFTPAISGDALRSLKAPGTAYNNPLFGEDPQPDHMSKFVPLPDTQAGDNGGVHINSGIPNHVFFLLAIAIGGKAWDIPGHIWYDTLVNRVGEFAQFEDFAKATYEGAGSLYGTAEQSAVRDAWSKVGIEIDFGASLRASKDSPKSRKGGARVDTESLAELHARLDRLAKRVDEIAKKLP